MALCSTLLLAAAAAAAPAASTCAVQAVAQQRGLHASVERRDAGFLLELRDGHGGLLLRRLLALPGETGCALADEAAALVLDRYFRDLGSGPVPRLPLPQQRTAARPPGRSRPAGSTGAGPARSSAELVSRAPPSATRAERAPVAAEVQTERAGDAKAEHAEGAPAEPTGASDPGAATEAGKPAALADASGEREPRKRVVLPAPKSGEAAFELENEAAPVGRGYTLGFSAGAAGLIGGDDVRPGVWFDLKSRTQRWVFSLTLVAAVGEADRARQDLDNRDHSAVDSGLLIASAQPCANLFLRACLGPFAGVRGIFGHASRFTKSFSDVSPELGFALSLERRLGNFEAGLSILAGLPVGTQAEALAGAAGSMIDMSVALTLGHQIF